MGAWLKLILTVQLVMFNMGAAEDATLEMSVIADLFITVSCFAPSGLVQCMHRIEYQPGDNYYKYPPQEEA